MRFRAKVYITLKEGILDPQGNTVRGALGVLGYNGVGDVRIGKYIVLDLVADDPGAARAQVAEMSRRLLANPVLERFSFELEEVPA